MKNLNKKQNVIFNLKRIKRILIGKNHLLKIARRWMQISLLLEFIPNKNLNQTIRKNINIDTPGRMALKISLQTIIDRNARARAQRNAHTRALIGHGIQHGYIIIIILVQTAHIIIIVVVYRRRSHQRLLLLRQRRENLKLTRQLVNIDVIFSLILLPGHKARSVIEHQRGKATLKNSPVNRGPKIAQKVRIFEI